MKTNETRNDVLRTRLRQIGLFGLLARAEEIAGKPWLDELLNIEEAEQQRRSLARRLRHARIGAFKPLSDFDWSWPCKVDRHGLEDLLGLEFLSEGVNIILVGPNGVGKTMIVKNLAHHTLAQGNTVRVTSASDMLADLAAQESTAALGRRLRRYTTRRLLCIDEVGYLSYSNRYADLLFEVVTSRYDQQKSVVVRTNKAFNEWSEVIELPPI